MKRKRNNLGQFVKNRSEFGFVNLSNYTSPQVKEVKNKEWISYGDDNNYFQYLIDRYNGSPTNNAAVNGISQAIYGKGLSATDSSRKPEQYAQMISLLKKDVVRKLCYDLKLMGQCAMQIIYSKDRSRVAMIEHMPIETLRAEKCNEDGDVAAYYYFKDWSNMKPNDKAMRIPAFGMSNESVEILYVKPYKAGFYYYAPVDYQGGLQYAELEEEISNYHLNNILNGLAPSMLINFNNGTPNEEERRLIESKIAQKFSGTSNAGKFILAFNDNKESQAEITPVQLSDAHNQYQFLSDESMRKIMVAHRVVSPMLLGIKDQTGLGNNADEIKTASLLMDNTVIRPFQNLLIDAFDQVLAVNDIALNLYFKTLQPLEFTEIDESIQDKETIEEETGVDMSIQLKQIDGETVYETPEEAEKAATEKGCKGYHVHEEDGKKWYMPCEKHPDMTEELADSLLESLEGEVMSEEWDMVDSREYKEENESIEDWANNMIESKEQKLEKKSIKSKKSGFSILDKSLYKVRYRYAEKYSSNKHRPFCSIMMKRNANNIVYRLEDIDKASREGVNKSFGHKGQPYDLFKYKGGVNCGHYWEEVLYRLKSKTMKKVIQNYDEVDSIPKSYEPKPRGWKDAKKAPKDMPNNGHHPNYK